MTRRPAPPTPRSGALVTIGRIVVLLLVLLLFVGVVIGGDLFVLPALALVLLAWSLVVVIDTVHWMIRTLLPTLALTVKTALVAAWSAIVDDPVGQRLHRFARSAAPILAPLRPVGRWARRRLGNHPTGLTLSSTVVVSVGATIALWRLGHGVDDQHSGISNFDLRIADVAGRLELGGQRRVMEALTNIGNTRSVLLLAALMLVGSLIARAWRSAALLVATLAASSLLVTVLKLRHARPRPALGQLVETSTSFPSGHAAASLSLAFGFVLWWWASGRKRSSLVAAIAIPVGLLIGYSRAYLSIHWLSDVAAGWLVATLAAALTLTIDRLIANRHRRARSESLTRRRPILSATASVVLAASVLAVSGRHNFPVHAPAVRPTQLASADPTELVSRLPRYSETLTGRHMEPIGLVIVARETAFRAAIREAGWSTADPITPGRVLRTYWAALRNRNDLTAPVTPTFLDTRVESFAIQRQSLGRGVKARHHARVWRLPLVSPAGCPVWAATASLDDRVEWTARTIFPNHHIAPAIDVEREVVARTLAAPRTLNDLGRFRLVGPTLGSNAAGNRFFTDGKIAVLRQPGCL